MTENAHYDTIIIGSGAGGLTAGVALAQAGQKVLVCEQHEVAGGWTHSFTLEGYRFSPGVHYIGEMGRHGMLRRVYEGLGVSGDIEFLELNPDGFDHIFIGEERFDIPKGKRKYMNRLKERFPHEADGIDAFFKEIYALNKIMRSWNKPRVLFKNFRALQWLFRSGGAMINKFLKDPLLIAFLSGQAGDHGVPMSKVSAPMHVGLLTHYFNGGYYPRGGAFAIPRAFVRALKRAGGELRLNTMVKRIIVENSKVQGVELADGEILHATNVVSNADSETTFNKLVGPTHLSKRLKRKLDKITYSTSCLSLFMAVDLDLKGMGFDSGNYWFYDNDDIDGIYKKGYTDHVLHNAPEGFFATITTLKDPSKMHKGHHTMEVFAFVGYEPFAKWADNTPGDREWEYEKLKEELTDKMLTSLDKRIPGLKDAVVFKDLGTPLTNAHYINAHNGNIYGTDKTVWQMGPLGFGIKTEIENLYMCGASTTSHGVAGVTQTGLRAAAAILDWKSVV